MIGVLQYLSWVSVHKYSSEIVVANEFHKLNLTCDEKLQGKHIIVENSCKVNTLTVSNGCKVTVTATNSCKANTLTYTLTFTDCKKKKVG